MRTVTLTNDFHNSEAKVIPTRDGFLTYSQVKRARRKLCGIKGCVCGQTFLNTRGNQEVGIEDCGDGTCQLTQ